MHPDDETDDIDILRENLRRLRKTVEEQREEIEEARTLVNSMREHLEEEAELRQQWIDVFDMQLDESGLWQFDSSQSRLWDELERVYDAYKKLLADWNRFVPQYNAVVAPLPVRPKGRPLAATEEQVERVRQLREEGRSYGDIVSRTGLSLTTVRTLVSGPEKAVEKRKTLVRRLLNKEAAARYRARKRQRDGIPAAIAEIEKKATELIRATRRF